ncbi:MAG TPA: hypothetical protein VJB97_03615 [Candidatus Paceibacterota bacterium]
MPGTSPTDRGKWTYSPRQWHLSTEIFIHGPAGQDPLIQEMARGHVERNAAAAATLFEWLVIDGLEHRIGVEDIENLASIGKTPEFMRKVVIELMLALRVHKERLRS